MAAQPANTEIKVYRTVRARRDIKRHESVSAIINRLRPLVMVVPGHEIQAGVLTRDTTVADFSPYCGEARYGVRGFPVVFGLKPQMTFASAQTTVPEADFAIFIGPDAFLQSTETGLTRDMYGDIAALDTGY